MTITLAKHYSNETNSSLFQSRKEKNCVFIQIASSAYVDAVCTNTQYVSTLLLCASVDTEQNDGYILYSFPVMGCGVYSVTLSVATSNSLRDGKRGEIAGRNTKAEIPRSIPRTAIPRDHN